MRIIAGARKGARLKMVPGKHVRPTSDRVKESLFQILGPYFSGGRVLDLFAGTGNLGLEALSRGMDEAVLVDQSAKSVQTIKQNIVQTKLEDYTRVLKKDAKLACRQLAAQGETFTLIFLDPPYQQNLLLPVMEEIAKRELLAADGRVVAELPENACLPVQIGKLMKARDCQYGSTSIAIYQYH